MKKNVFKAISIVQIILTIIVYFSLSYHFDYDGYIFALLARTDLISVLIRLSLYVVPGIHLLSGLYGLTFTDRAILKLIGIFEIISCCLSFLLVGGSTYIFILNVICLILAFMYLMCVK